MKIRNVRDLIIGKTYLLTDVTRHPFRRDLDLNQPVRILEIGARMSRVRFVESDIIQHFKNSRLVDGHFALVEVNPKPVDPTQLTPQCRQILSRLMKGQTITQRSALMDHGIMSLTRRICDLKDAGYKIESVMKTNPATGQRYASYYLAA